MKKKKSLVRVISLCLILALMLGGMPVVALDNATAATTAPADTADRTVTEAALPDAKESLLGPGELSYAALQTAVLAPTDIPDALPAGAVEAKGHVNRVYEQEVGLSHLLFQNRDGGKTAYFYGTPIKYVAADGSVRDKSKTLIAVNKTYGALGYDYGVEDNSFRQYYAQDPATGVLLELGEGSVRIIPQPIGSLVVPRGVLRENTFVYNHIFGNTTALVYTPQLSGVKEDIVLRSFAGVSDFTFTYRTNGLSLIEIDGTYTLVDESGFPQATLGAVVLIDAEGKRAGGSLTVTETANGTYTVTVHADRAFLTSPSTVYPVTVDPDIIEMVGLPHQMFDSYNVCTSNAYWNISANSGKFLLGSLNDDCTGRIVYRMPMFIKDAIPLCEYDDLNPYQVASATLNIHIQGHRTNNIIAQPITTSHTLTEHSTDQALYDACEFYGDLPYNTTAVAGANATYAIDVTAVVRSWLAYNTDNLDCAFGAYNPDYGMALVQENESVFAVNGAPMLMHIDEVQYNTFLELDFGAHGGEFYIHSVRTGEFLNVTDDYMQATLNTFNEQTTTKWAVTYYAGTEYLIERLGSNGYLYIHPSMQFPSTDYILPGSYNADARWSIMSELMHFSLRNTYANVYLMDSGAGPWTTTTAEPYESILWQLIPVDGYVNLTNFALPDAFVEPGATVTLETLSTPSNATLNKPEDYIWTSDNENFEVLFGGEIDVPLEGGIATITATHKHTGIPVSCTIKSGAVKEATYKLESRANGRFADISGPSTNVGANITQYNLHGGEQQEWSFILLSDGTYLIQSCYSEHYLSLASSGTGIVQREYADATKWIVTTTSGGACRLTPSTVSSAALSINVGEWFQNGSQLIQKTYTNDTTYDDEWFIRPKILPLSGNEIEYNPGFWNNNSDIKKGTNCYAYALNNHYYPNTNIVWWIEPGDTEEGFEYEREDVCADLMLEGVGYDSHNLGFTFMSIGKYDTCPAGTYKVALVVDEGTDFHWYRQNADGTWSHKPGDGYVINSDASGNLIYDPETANRSYSYADYDIFVGFFAISPLNNLYVIPPVANSMEEENETENIQICMHSLAYMLCVACSTGVCS